MKRMNIPDELKRFDPKEGEETTGENAPESTDAGENSDEGTEGAE